MTTVVFLVGHPAGGGHHHRVPGHLPGRLQHLHRRPGTELRHGIGPTTLTVVYRNKKTRSDNMYINLKNAKLANKDLKRSIKKI